MPDQPFDEIEQRLFAANNGRMRVLGIRRTGQHAVINWILRNSGRENTVFLNSCTMRRSAVRTCGQSELNGQFAGKFFVLKKALEAYLTPQKHPFVLISYEAGYEEGELTSNFPDAEFDREILVTRSFVNWLPSFIRLMRVMNRGSASEALDISNGIVFEMMRYKAHLLAAQASNHVVVCFDQWAKAPNYRSQKLAALGLDELDTGLGAVQKYGGGSSFSAFNKPVEALALTTRWQTMVDDPFAQNFLRIAKADTAFMEVLAALYSADIPIINQLAQT
ncbi:MAG: hypothetical protein GQ535_07455 [Rhodobacteraceae bacterium]|nr:hypothetical protein [Paracoccaceae bacterium]